MQKGFSIVVHSVMNSMEPPVSAEMSQMAKNLKFTDSQMCPFLHGRLLWHFMVLFVILEANNNSRSLLMGKCRAAVIRWWRRRYNGSDQPLGVQSPQQSGRVRVPVYAVYQTGCVRGHLCKHMKTFLMHFLLFKTLQPIKVCICSKIEWAKWSKV